MPPSPAAFKPCCPLEKPCLPLRDLAACSPTRGRTRSGSVACYPLDPQGSPEACFLLAAEGCLGARCGLLRLPCSRGLPARASSAFSSPAGRGHPCPAFSPPAPGTPSSNVSSPFQISSRENREGFHQGIWGCTLEPRAPGPFVHGEVPLTSPLPAAQPGRLPA